MTKNPSHLTLLSDTNKNIADILIYPKEYLFRYNPEQREIKIEIPISAFEGRLHDKKGKPSEDKWVRMGRFEIPELNFIKETLTTACSVIGKTKNTTGMKMKFFQIERDFWTDGNHGKNMRAMLKFESKDEKVEMSFRYENADDDPIGLIHSAKKESKLFFRDTISNIKGYILKLEKRDLANKKAEEKVNANA